MGSLCTHETAKIIDDRVVEPFPRSSEEVVIIGDGVSGYALVGDMGLIVGWAGWWERVVSDGDCRCICVTIFGVRDGGRAAAR